MDFQNRVYFPLRSNIYWFQSLDLKKAITDHVKKALLVYDELCFEDGTLTVEVLEHGGWALYSPPGSIQLEQRTIEYERDLKPEDLKVALRPSNQPLSHIILQGKTIYRFKIDYYEIFRRIDISTYDFLKFVTIDKYKFPKEASEIIRQQSSEDKHTIKNIQINDFFRGFAIDSLNFDLVTSILLKAAIVLDSMHRNILRLKCRLPKSVVSSLPVKEDIAIRHLLSVAVPNFSELEIEYILELRSDDLWRSFRNFVSDMLSTIKTDPEILIDNQNLEEIIRRKIDHTLFEELEKKYATGSELAIDLGLGITSLIPGWGILPTLTSMAKSTNKYLQDKSGWFAFILKLSNKR